MAILPGLTVFLGLTDLLHVNLSLTGGGHSAGLLQAPLPSVRIEDHPYQASVRVDDRHRCGGSIISNNKILTAASCVIDVRVQELTVRVGSPNHFDGESIAVRSIKIHETFNRNNLDCNIAILTLSRPLTFGPQVKAIELAQRRPPTNTLAYVTAWGVLNDGSRLMSDEFKVSTVRLMDQAQCRSWYPNRVITSRMLCGDNVDPHKDICEGDAGSPLVDNSTGKQVGVLSGGGNCGHTSVPIVYASVAELISSKDV